MGWFKKVKQGAEAVKDTGVADVAVTTIPERAALDSIRDGDIVQGMEDSRDDTFKAIDKADASDKKATGYKDS